MKSETGDLLRAVEKIRFVELRKRYRASVEKKNQPDATEWFIALIFRSIYFGHLYAHYQELKTITVL